MSKIDDIVYTDAMTAYNKQFQINYLLEDAFKEVCRDLDEILLNIGTLTALEIKTTTLFYKKWFDSIEERDELHDLIEERYSKWLDI